MALTMLNAVLCTLILFCEAYPSFDVKLSSDYFDGLFVLFPVKREKLQQRLNEINTQFGREDVKLFLPSEPVLQNIISSDEHVIMLAFARYDALAFDKVLNCTQKQTLYTKGEGFGIVIPYLTSGKEDAKSMNLQMEVFLADGEEHIEPNVIFPPPIVADKFVRDEEGNNTDIQFEKNDLKLHLLGGHSQPCVSHGEQEVKDAQNSWREFQISRSGPDFSICDQFPDLQVDVCNIYRNQSYNSILKEAGSNVCIYWEKHNDVKKCKGNFQVRFISQAMKDHLMLDESQHIIEASFLSGPFDIRLVFPCIQ